MATRAPRAAAPRAAGPLEAYVLHRYDWSESSVILDLFTRERGRLAVVAKGAKRPYSQLRSVLLPFQRIHVGLGRVPKAGRDDADEPADETPREVQTLRSAEWAGGSTLPAGAGLFRGFYMNELLMKLLARQDPHPALFDAYAQSLASLGDADEITATAALRAFELRLLHETGVLPELDVVTATQQPLRDDARYRLQPEAGVVETTSEAGVSGAVLTQLQAALGHGALAALQHACAADLPRLKPMLRETLHYHLGSSVLHTRQVMQGVQRLDR